MTKKYFIKTLGCKVNQYESQAMRESLERAGYRESESGDDADIYVVNTCTVTGQADSESRQFVRRFHNKNEHAEIVVAGCCVETEPDAAAFSTLPGVSRLVKNSEKWRIADLIENDGAPGVPRRVPYTEPTISDFKGRTRAFIKIQDGCSQRCSYCRVALVRGPLKSKPVGIIREEARRLADKGFKELVLSGICLGAWGAEERKKEGIIEALRALEKVNGEFRIRLSSIEPKHVTGELLSYIAATRRVCSHLHIPLQSGDDSVLKRMNRAYTAGEYCSLIARVKAAIPDISVTTDVIVGFPGETDQNFENSVRVLKKILPVRVHVFPYSPRVGTAAFGYDGALDGTVVKARTSKMRAAALGMSYLSREKFLNRRLRVLVETTREKESGMLEGYSDNYVKIQFKGPDKLMGTIVPLEIEHLTLDKSIGSYQGIRW
ncbi:MAG: tRNA (N(6)-L-threonylcarbamoyladenosine(37)-C(2))-methylthiotransferase MtaB [Candidatus Omnitrophota bacterium]